MRRFVGLLSALLIVAAPLRAETVTVKLVALNDLHGHLWPGATLPVPDPRNPDAALQLPVGGAAYLASLVRQLAAETPYSVVVAAGDLVGATPLRSALFADEPTIQALNFIGLDYAAVGNHEFDHGRERLLRQQRGGCDPQRTAGRDTCVIADTFSGAAFRYLAANVIDERSGEPLLPAYGIERFELGNGRTLAVGFIGIVLRDTPSMVTPTGVAGLRFADEAQTANALVPALKAQGVDAIVLLIHQGIRTSVPNAPGCAGAAGDLLRILDALSHDVDLVVSGHTHWPYVCRGQGTTHPAPYTSAGKYGQFLTDIDLRFDAQSRALLGIEAENRLVVNDTAPNPLAGTYPTLPADRGVEQLAALYRRAAAPLADAVVARITADIGAGDVFAPGSAGQAPIGRLVANAQLAATQGPEQRAEVAFVNAGGVRGELIVDQISGGEQPGEVTYAEAFTVQPFGNDLVTMTLSGAEIYELLGQQWRDGGAEGRYMLQVSDGFAYTWDPAAAGNKVVAGSVRLHGEPIDLQRDYRVTVASFLAAGGDGFDLLLRGRERVGGGPDIEAWIDYLRAHSPLSPPALGAVRRVAAPAPIQPSSSGT